MFPSPVLRVSLIRSSIPGANPGNDFITLQFCPIYLWLSDTVCEDLRMISASNEGADCRYLSFMFTALFVNNKYPGSISRRVQVL